MKQHIGWILGIVGIVALLFFLVRLGSPSSTIPQNGGQASVDSGTLAEPVTDKDHIKGNPEAPITIVEYSDFQCPACASFHPVVQQLLEEMDDQVKFVYRHYPLRQIHSNAQLAAQAAEAAGMQDKFFEMHDLLFENQRSWSNLSDPTEHFTDYAQQLELDTERFLKDLTSRAAQTTVSEHYSSGTSSGVRGTPSFYVNGQKITNPQSVAAFKAAIEQIATQ